MIFELINKMSRLSKVSKGKPFVCQPMVDVLFQICSFVYRKGRAEWDDLDSLDDGYSLSLGDDGSGNSSDEESDPDIETLLQQRRGKKRVLSESPIKAPDPLERSSFGKKSKERYRKGIRDIISNSGCIVLIVN